MTPRCRVPAVLMLLLAAWAALAAANDPDAHHALRGIGDVAIAIDGVPAEFARYGLTADGLREAAARRLAAHGVAVVGGAGAAPADAGDGQLTITLHTNRGAYAFLSYSVSLALARRLPIGAEGDAFVRHTVWSQGRHGVINPSDLPRIEGFVETLLDAFVADLGRDNAGRR